jgi:hypothetical protein
MFQQAHQLLSERKDKSSGSSDMQRAAPQYEMSGKAVRALLAEADLATTKAKKAVEDGLTQATTLRIHLMMQHLRINRMLRISNRAERAGYKLLVAKSEGQTVIDHKLARPEGDLRAEHYEDANGEMVRVLEISDDTIRRFDLKLRLDTGRERSKDERMDLVTQMLNYVGPGAGVETMLVAVELMDVPNFDRWKEALLKEDAKTQMAQAVGQAQEDLGVPLPQIIAMAQQMMAMMQAGGAPAPGGGAPAPTAAPVAVNGGGPGGPPPKPAPVTAPTSPTPSPDAPGAAL